MPEVQRYSAKIDFIIHPDGIGMREDEAGEYVSYEDYQSLLADNYVIRYWGETLIRSRAETLLRAMIDASLRCKTEITSHAEMTPGMTGSSYPVTEIILSGVKIIMTGVGAKKCQHINQDNDDTDFFRVYFRKADGALECTGEFSDRGHALEYATLMADKHQVTLYDETFSLYPEE